MNQSILLVTVVGSKHRTMEVSECGTISIFIVEKEQEAQQKNNLYMFYFKLCKGVSVICIKKN
jgi:hypothetical protein